MFVPGIFSPKSLDFLRNSTARLCILEGSVRSGKTINTSIRWITYVATAPKGDMVMCGKTLPTLKRNVLNDLFDILGKSNIKWVNKQEGELQIFDRRVFCIGATNEEAESKIRGATFAGALCDEVSLYPESFFNQLMTRMSVEGAQVFCTTNPDSPFHWFYLNYMTNDAITSKQVWHFDLDDNPNLDPEYVMALKQMYTGVFYRRFILGEWCVAEGAIYDMFDINRHVRPTPNDKTVAAYLVSCDYGTSTVMSWSMIAKYTDGTYHKEKEYYYDAVKEKQQKTDGQFADDFMEFIDGFNVYAIYCDPSAASWKAELRMRGLNVLDAENNVINGIRCVASLLSAGRYTISPTCKSTIKEYPMYAWDPEAQKHGLDKPIKVHDHACDSDRYALYSDAIYGVAGVFRRQRRV